MDDLLELYKNIRKRRIELGLSQEELANKVGYKDRTSIAKIETGKIDLPQSKIMEFAIALGMQASDLMGWDETDPDPYYLDPEAAKLAEEIYKNPDLKILFDAARDVEPEDIKVAIDVLERFKKIRR